MQYNFCTICSVHFFLPDEKAILSGEHKLSPSISTVDQIYPDGLIPMPSVTIMVESPKEPPNNDFGLDLTASLIAQQAESTTSSVTPSPSQSTIANSTIIDIEDPIDVNVQRDTSNIFYHYTEPEVTDLRIRNLARQITEETSDLDEINVADDNDSVSSPGSNDDNNHDANSFDRRSTNHSNTSSNNQQNAYDPDTSAQQQNNSGS